MMRQTEFEVKNVSQPSKKKVHLSGAAYGKSDFEEFAEYFMKHYARRPLGAEILAWADLYPEKWREKHPEEPKRRRR